MCCIRELMSECDCLSTNFPVVFPGFPGGGACSCLGDGTTRLQGVFSLSVDQSQCKFSEWILIRWSISIPTIFHSAICLFFQRSHIICKSSYPTLKWFTDWHKNYLSAWPTYKKSFSELYRFDYVTLVRYHKNSIFILAIVKQKTRIKKVDCNWLTKSWVNWSKMFFI